MTRAQNENLRICCDGAGGTGYPVSFGPRHNWEEGGLQPARANGIQAHVTGQFFSLVFSFLPFFQ
ncbi:unnamed protein product [Mycena citricolor]|uniref:Uncharacterized protein n=1 Tax=Mycena citricolor TaxID=2018698 RepID=A0AAD2HMA6_9AGAR|nr:unnamed protein product [Mycena citricolor]CAK5263675.1 unnamed protein product [Mycena citricolor]CAK5278512.1 unnamed protein product [Mycena citricolor]